jgi:hypothetical protein
LSGSDDKSLDKEMLAAHAAADCDRLIQLYEIATDRREAAGDVDAACFYLTYAYVFALELGRDEATNFHKRLKEYGREE